MTTATPLPTCRVIHAVDRYLPFSQVWIHRQIQWSPHDGAALVAGREWKAALETYPVADRLVLSSAFPVRYPLLAHVSPGRRAGLALARHFVQSRRPDVLHAHFGNTGWRWAPLARRWGIPLVTSFYGRDLSEYPRSRPWWRRRYHELFEWGARFLCEGPAMAASLRALGCPADRIGLQRLGIDATGIAVRVRERRPDEPLEVLVAARFVEKKGLPDAIAAAGLAAQHVPISLTIAGGPEASRAGRAEARRVEAAVAASHLGPRLHRVGVVPHDQLLALALRSHVLLQPSKTAANGDSEGGSPVTLIDVAATGLPAVATRHADIPDAVSDGVSGLLSDEGDVTALAESLVRLAREPELLWRLSEGAAARARGPFGADRCAASLREHYRVAAGWSPASDSTV